MASKTVIRPISKAVDEVPEETPCGDTCKPELFSPSPQDLGDCSMPENASQDVPEKPLGAPKVLCDLFNCCTRCESAPKFT